MTNTCLSGCFIKGHLLSNIEKGVFGQRLLHEIHGGGHAFLHGFKHTSKREEAYRRGRERDKKIHVGVIVGHAFGIARQSSF